MRSFIAVVALLLASAFATGALFAYLAHETVLEPERAGAVLSDGLGSSELRARVLARTVPGYANLPAPYRAEVDRAAQSTPVDRALSEVEVDSDGRADLSPVQQELSRALNDAGYPEVAATVERAGRGSTVRIPPRIWAQYTEARDASWWIATRAGLAAAALYLVGILAARSKRTALMSTGLALLISGALAWVSFRMIPELAPTFTRDPWLQDLAALVSAPTATIVATLLPVAVVGVLLMVGSLAVPTGRRGWTAGKP